MQPTRRLFLAASLVVAGCSSPEKPSDPPPKARNIVPERSEIQRYEDTRVSGEKLTQFLGDPDPFVRRRALLALGRVGNAADIPAVAAKITDPDSKTAEMAVFALGLIGDGKIREEVRPVLEDPEPEMRALALEALSRVGEPGDLGAATKLVGDRSARVRGEVGLAVWRMCAKAQDSDKSRIRSAVVALGPLLHDPDFAVCWRTAWALSKLDASPLAAELENATKSQDAVVRAFATRALGRLEQAPVEALIRASADPDPRVAWEGVNALEKLEGGNVVEALNKAASAGEAVTIARAIELLGFRGEATPGTLKAASRHPSPTVRGVALWAKAYRNGMDAFDEAVAALKSADETMRRAAARALVAIGNDKAKEELSKIALGQDHLVQLEMLGEIEATNKRHPTIASDWDAILKSCLEVPDAPVRATVTEVLGPRFEETAWDNLLEKAFRASSGKDMADAREAILAWFEKAKRNRALANDALKDESPAVREQAAKTFFAVTGEKVAAEPVPEAAIEATRLEDIGFSTIVKIETTRGSIRIRLLPDAAPAMCSAFLRLVRSGFYDGKRWHRVVPNFVIQGGDPRGDGWGDAGFTLRDEWSREAFTAGAVGMATAGKDTGSCQLFITSIPAPHLDGRYTVFARVEEGMDVVRAVEIGDRIVRMTVEK